MPSQKETRKYSNHPFFRWRLLLVSGKVTLWHEETNSWCREWNDRELAVCLIIPWWSLVFNNPLRVTPVLFVSHPFFCKAKLPSVEYWSLLEAVRTARVRAGPLPPRLVEKAWNQSHCRSWGEVGEGFRSGIKQEGGSSCWPRLSWSEVTCWEEGCSSLRCFFFWYLSSCLNVSSFDEILPSQANSFFDYIDPSFLIRLYLFNRPLPLL